MVLKLERSSEVSLVASLNISLMSVTLEVLKLERSSEVSLVASLNISLMLVTFEVSVLPEAKLVKFLHPEKALVRSVQPKSPS
jgi:hypothetical protein